ncbi:hypothetical protein ARMSODRAFT_974046 [Armillaria solidipes]|uniref:Uncharacterized protein n=1 Tax=Armillaria solidipes TaxID=1076256 RepID=A0A2H3BPD2_9AGAR|nr:hypothetical protein ARMSODRAFT_974046 [Armillaria solidipes]
MTGNHPTAAPINDEALLAALFSALQITPAQHDQIGCILSRIQPAAVPAPASWSLDSDASGPPAVPVPPAVPLLPPNPPYGPLPANAVVVLQGYDYHVPHPTRRGPFYMIVRGLDIGIFTGWEDAAALVIGVSGSIYCKVPNVHVGCACLDAALAGHGAAWLP